MLSLKSRPPILQDPEVALAACIEGSHWQAALHLAHRFRSRAAYTDAMKLCEELGHWEQVGHVAVQVWQLDSWISLV